MQRLCSNTLQYGPTLEQRTRLPVSCSCHAATWARSRNACSCRTPMTSHAVGFCRHRTQPGQCSRQGGLQDKRDSQQCPLPGCSDRLGKPLHERYPEVQNIPRLLLEAPTVQLNAPGTAKFPAGQAWHSRVACCPPEEIQPEGHVTALGPMWRCTSKGTTFFNVMMERGRRTLNLQMEFQIVSTIASTLTD